MKKRYKQIELNKASVTLILFRIKEEMTQNEQEYAKEKKLWQTDINME